MHDLNLNGKFEKQWKVVEKAFQDFKDLNILPITIKNGEYVISEITEVSLEQQLNSLHNEKFTIAICGQVKAGKSTLLNSLFFGDDVLPVFDTPMTAKLTFLEYKKGEKCFTVEFYTYEEWNKIIENSSTQAKTQLDERMAFCAENFGVRKDDYINHAPVHCNSLLDLDQYVSVPSQGKKSSPNCGKFTPFVKQVTIHLDEDILKNIRVVDTPGLNDSNIINSLQTTEWIKEAHAVVYVLDVTGAHGPDVEFFQKYFPSSASKARIFVQNKIDTNHDWHLVKNSIKLYGEKKVYRDLGLFTNETICSYSSLLELRRIKLKNGKPTTEDEDYAFEFVGDDNFDPNPDDLRGQISNKLYANAGAIRIENALSQFVKIGTEKIHQLENEAHLKKDEGDDYLYSKEQLEKDIEELEDFVNNLSEKSESIAERNLEKIYNISKFLENCIDEKNNKIKHKVINTIESLNSTAQIRTLLPNIFISAIKSEYYSLNIDILKAKSELRKYLQNQRLEINSLAISHRIADKLVNVPHMDTNFASKIDDKIKELNYFSQDLEKVLPNSFMNIFTFLSTVKENATSEIINALFTLKEKCSSIMRELSDEAYEQMKQYALNVDAWAKEKQKTLDEVKNNLISNKNTQQQCYELAKELEKQANELKTKIEYFKSIF